MHKLYELFRLGNMRTTSSVGGTMLFSSKRAKKVFSSLGSEALAFPL